MTIKVERKALGFYKASQTVSLSIGSPYRDMFCYWSTNVKAWARSEQRAAERCKAKVEQVKQWDREWRQKKDDRTSQVSV